MLGLKLIYISKRDLSIGQLKIEQVFVLGPATLCNTVQVWGSSGLQICIQFVTLALWAN